jgi:hypothetical protein
MPTFLTREDIYRILQRELPEDIYPDGPPDRYYSTADNDSVAAVFASMYSTMESIYNNMFVITANEQLNQWETNLLASTPVGDISVDQRRSNLLAFLRSQDNISYWAVLNAILGFVPIHTFVELRVRAYVGDHLIAQMTGANIDLIWGPDWTSGDPAPAGVTVTDSLRTDEAELLALRRHAYVYDVIIWGYELGVDETARLEELLSAIEPARSDHTLASFAEDMRAGGPEVTALTIKNYSNAKVDETSGTGYRASAPFYFGFDGDDNAAGFGSTLNQIDAGVFNWLIE